MVKFTNYGYRLKRKVGFSSVQDCKEIYSLYTRLHHFLKRNKLSLHFPQFFQPCPGIRQFLCLSKYSSYRKVGICLPGGKHSTGLISQPTKRLKNLDQDWVVPMLVELLLFISTRWGREWVTKGFSSQTTCRCSCARPGGSLFTTARSYCPTAEINGTILAFLSLGYKTGFKMHNIMSQTRNWDSTRVQQKIKGGAFFS